MGLPSHFTAGFIQNSIQEHDALSEDLLRAQGEATFLASAGELVAFQRGNALLEHIFSQELHPWCDVEAWTKEVLSPRSFGLSWPTDRKDRLALQLRLLSTLADKRIRVDVFAHQLFGKSGGNVDAEVRTLIDQIFRPLVRDYRQFISEIVDAYVKMNAGKMLRDEFEKLMEVQGTAISVQKSSEDSSGPILEVTGFKSTKMNQPGGHVFKFADRVDVAKGDVLQITGARDLWRATEVEDIVNAGVFINLDVSVEKIGAPLPPISGGGTAVHVNAPVYGALQIGSHHSTQNVVFQLSRVQSHVQKLRSIVDGSGLSDFDKDDAREALARIEQLAAREKTSEVTKRIGERLDLLKKILRTCKDAAPLIIEIGKLFIPSA